MIEKLIYSYYIPLPTIFPQIILEEEDNLKRIITIGFCLTLVLLLSIPVVPAIKLNSLKSVKQNNILDTSTNINSQNLTETIKTSLTPKYPYLFFIVSMITNFRFARALFLFSISTYDPPDWWRWPPPYIEHPLLYLRALMLFCTTDVWYNFWWDISNILGWNWYN